MLSPHTYVYNVDEPRFHRKLPTILSGAIKVMT